MTILFYALVAIVILHTAIQIAIGLTEIIIGVTQMICALLMMAFIFFRRLIFGARKQTPASLQPSQRRAYCRYGVYCHSRGR
jgi:hypothetical protein